MLKRMRVVVSVISVVSLLIPMVLFAAPPPAGIQDVLTEMGKFEANYQDGKWDEAAQSSQAMEKKIKEIFAQAQRDDFILEEALVNLHKLVAAKNAAEVEAGYVPVQKQFFNYVSHFDHEVHPILTKIEQHIMKDAPAAYAKQDYPGVLQNMQTAAMLIVHGKAVFVKKGIPEQDINTYVSKVQALSLAGKADESGKMGELLGKLQESYTIFMGKYKK